MSFFANVFKDKEFDAVSQQIDDLIDNIPSVDSSSPVENVTGKFITQSILAKSDDTLTKLFENVSVPSERLSRYQVYKEINRSVPIIKRIIKVYISHLLQKNPVDGKCIIYREAQSVTKDDNNQIRTARRFAEDVERNFSLIKKLKDSIIPKKLLYGNCYVEVVDIKKETDDIDVKSLRLLNENLSRKIQNLNRNNITENYLDLIINDMATVICDADYIDESDSYKMDPLYEATTEPSDESQDDENQNNTETKADVEDKIKDTLNPFLDVIIKIHDPHNIIVLENRYGTRLGYLEVHRDQEKGFENVTQNISSMIGKITTISKNSMSEQTIVDTLIKKILQQTLSTSDKFKNKSMVGKTISGLNDEVFIFIKRLMVEQGLNNKKKYNRLKTRFIPINRMVDFNIPSTDFAPYGESVIDPLILPCKLFMLAQLSNVVIKLSRAAVVRKWIKCKSLSLVTVIE